MNYARDLENQLIEAADRGDLEQVKKLLLAGANVQTCDNHPLRIAIHRGNKDLAEFLVDQGADKKLFEAEKHKIVSPAK